MGTTLIDNFDYRGKRFLDSRQSVATLAALKAMPDTQLPDGFRAYCQEYKQWYEFNSANTADATTGKWRKIMSEVADNILDLCEKFICLRDDRFSIKSTPSDGTYSFNIIDDSGFVFLKNPKYLELDSIGYAKISPCDITVSSDKILAFSDTKESYTPCSYKNYVYIVSTDRSNIKARDILLGTLNKTIYTKYPIIYSKLLAAGIDAKIEAINKELIDINNDIRDLSSEISGISINDWGWENSDVAPLLCWESVIPVPIVSGYVSCKCKLVINQLTTISLYEKVDDKYIKIEDVHSFDGKIGVNSITIPEKIEVPSGKDVFLGISHCSYNSEQGGEFILISNGSRYSGLFISFFISSELQNEISVLKAETASHKSILENIDGRVLALESCVHKEIEENEYWVKAYGNVFNSEDYALDNGAVISETSFMLPAQNSYVALNKTYWSDRRIHKFVVTLNNPGVLIVNLARNISNGMFDTFSGGNWTSKFKIDFINKMICFGDDISHEIDMDFKSEGQYIVELKYVRRIFTVKITDFATMEVCSAVLDARDANVNGGFKNTLVIQNQSGSYKIESIETYEVCNPKLVLFGDSITEAIGRVGAGENYSELITEKIKSCTIVAQGGAGAGSWDRIFEDEIKHIKPKYCSFHMGVNGGVSTQQLYKFISDCETIGTIPIINHVICTASYQNKNSNAVYNGVIDATIADKGYAGYYGDIATAENHDISMTPNYLAAAINGGEKWGLMQTSMSKDAFRTSTLPVGTTVVENGSERVLELPLSVIVDIHPTSEGHMLMADRFLKEVLIL